MKNSLKPQNIKINQHNYTYYEFGDGVKTLLFLHGIGDKISSWLDLKDKISGNYKIVLLELPGHDGISSQNFRTLNDYADYFHEFIKFHNYKNLQLSGFSLGGIFTLQLLQRYPEIKINKAIIWASPINGLNNLLIFIKSLYKIIIKLNITISKELICNFSKKFNLNVTDKSVESLAEFPAEEMIKNLNLINDFKISQKGQTPILYIFGSNDPFTKKNAPAIIKNSKNKNWKLKCLQNGGHLGTNTDLKKLYKIINSFLNE